MNHPRCDDFHFARIFRGDTLPTAIARHEHYLMARLGLRPGMRVLNVGCGTGSAALELANFANVSVVGVDNEYHKIQRAVQSARQSNLSSRVSFVHADITHLTGSAFADESFDAIFAIESLRVASSFRSMYKQLGRLLKRGGKLAVYEWCWTPSFDLGNINHCRLAEVLELTTGISQRDANQRSVQSAMTALKESQLQLLHHEDLAARAVARPWYLPLESALSDSRIPWPSHPSESSGVFGGLTRDAAAVLAKAGHLQLFTPMAMFVAMKL